MHRTLNDVKVTLLYASMLGSMELWTYNRCKVVTDGEVL